jgi:hypothetical protein
MICGENMATLSKTSAEKPAMGSTTSPDPKHDTSQNSNMLTQSEIDSLRSEAKADAAWLRAQWDKTEG